jgi:hypothetical protein
MKKKKMLLGVLMFAMLIALVSTAQVFAKRGGQGGRGDGPIIYVVSQGLYYDSIVTADPLPMKGPFQQLIPTSGGLETMHGPGDRGYVGGRWWVDVDGDGEMNDADHFFSCPLLGPGRIAP